MERVEIRRSGGNIGVKKINNALIPKIGFVCFYIAIVTEVFLVIIDKSSYTNPFEGRIFQITFILCFLKVCMTKYTFREYVTVFLFCVLGVVSYFVTGRNEILRLVMLIADL